MSDFDDSVICRPCINDKVLAGEFEYKGGVCDFCQEKRKVTEFADVALRIDEVFHEYVRDHQYTPFDEMGETPSSLLCEMIECDLPVAEAFVQYLGEGSGADDGPYLYDETSTYDIDIPYNPKYRQQWERYCKLIISEHRFFNREAERILAAIFSGIRHGELKTITSPVFVTLQPTKKSRQSIYRGRIANTDDDVKRILAAAAQQLGPPPSRLATQQRMTPAGIVAFYGTLEPDTCVAEMRVPVGGAIVIGKFEILRPLRLLDLRALQQANMNLSYFDADFKEKHAYVSFLQQFHDEIRKPVVREGETLEYLPIQFLAEYIATRLEPKVAGVLFSTSQTTEGTNIVLFNNYAKVEPDAECTWSRKTTLK